MCFRKKEQGPFLEKSVLLNGKHYISMKEYRKIEEEEKLSTSKISEYFIAVHEGSAHSYKFVVNNRKTYIIVDGRKVKIKPDDNVKGVYIRGNVFYYVANKLDQIG